MTRFSLPSSTRTLLTRGVFLFSTALALMLGASQAMAARPKGIDVSRWQGTVNWTSVKGSGITFAWAQATRGAYLTNVNFVANMNNGKTAGVLMGAYHYATPATNSAATEANYFWNLAGPYIKADAKTLMPMLDIEEFNGHIGATSYSDWANQWANAVIAKANAAGVKVKVVLYSSASFMCNFDSSCSSFGSWIANYNGQNPDTGTPWSCCTSCNLWGGGSWNFWQYSSTGSVPGITGNVDLDTFNGTSTQLTSTWVATAIAAPIISNVSAGNISDTGATITWTTDINSDSVVNYGLTTTYGSTVSNGTMVVNHSINLTGLSASTTYHYRVKSKNSAGQVSTSADFTFTTLAAGQVNDIIIDNPQATFVGTWSTGSTATDKFGTDYRYAGQGTGSSYAQFTPNILTAGNYDVYEWHTQGANRGTDTPHVITYNGGTITLAVNQQTGGGAWNLLGTFNFAAGTAGKVKITDAISGAGLISMADAIKFSYVPSAPPPTPPTAPSGLTASASSSTQISLTWTDNSTDESGFRVEKSTDNVNFTQFVSLSPNVTSTTASGLNGSTTYYFRVRAYNANGNSAYSAVASATTQPVAEIIIDNTSATFTGTWSTGTGSTDKYGTDYRYKAGGTGTSFVTYTPNILVAGNYQVYAMYPQGSNRTTTAPYVINYNGGSGSATLNQQINGGVWNLLGTFNFAAGTAGNVRVTDNFAGTSVVMADAIRLVYVP